jgi:hypothetical protein
VSAAVWGFLGVALGGVLTGGISLWREQLVTRREREARQAERVQLRQDARDAFQRDAIITLQDALRDYWGHVVHAHTHMHVPEGKTTGETLEMILSRKRAAYSPLILARAKVFDDELRRLVWEFGFPADLATSQDVDQAREGLATCREQLVQIDERVNVLLRQLF